jgi:hypothetical protein
MVLGLEATLLIQFGDELIEVWLTNPAQAVRATTICHQQNTWRPGQHHPEDHSPCGAHARAPRVMIDSSNLRTNAAMPSETGCAAQPQRDAFAPPPKSIRYLWSGAMSRGLRTCSSGMLDSVSQRGQTHPKKT